ncbi:MAG TPA: VOC family protein [Candidatus Polarisedimenticolia bacterium]|nr:VOC family protein [Candidatus Polarisedimenticolia bacterium]
MRGRSGPCLVAAPLCALMAALFAAEASGAVRSVETVGMTVSDVDRSAAFFTEVLGFARVADREVSGPGLERLQGLFGARARVVTLRLGEELLELTEYLAPQGRPIPSVWRSHDRWFQHIAIVVSDMAEAFTRLRSAGVRFVSTGPQRLPDWNPAAGGIEAFYFKDPDGHVLEVIAFPAGKGDPRWRQARGRLFLGIDHTAIVVEDTAASLSFYGRTLGMRVAGESENHGVEQEHLNGVFGARLRITALRASKGPGVELLEYLAPSDGHPYPPDSRSADLWHWQVRMESDAVEEDARAARKAGGSWISPGEVTLPDGGLGFRLGALLRDPDGHAVLLSE